MQYQGRIHLMQKELMDRYFEELTRSAEGEGKPAMYMLVGSNLAELAWAMDMLPVYPEMNALQLAIKKVSLPYLLKAEELGYSMDNCGYVKADIGLWFSGRETPFAKIPPPALLLCNYSGCNTFLNWFEHLREYSGAEIFILDIPFPRIDGERRPHDRAYVLEQLKELVRLCEKVTGRRLDRDRLGMHLAIAQEMGELWRRLLALERNRPAPFDAHFDALTLTAPFNSLRGREDSLLYAREVLREMEGRAAAGRGPLPQERFRYVADAPPPYPYLKAFRDLFSRWGAVAVASTYANFSRAWEMGFEHDPGRPLESLAAFLTFDHQANAAHLKRRRELIARTACERAADAVVIHSVKSCRLFSAGQADMREYLVKEKGLPTLIVESDLEDPRYFSEAQIRNRVDAFFEALEHRKILRG